MSKSVVSPSRAGIIFLVFILAACAPKETEKKAESPEPIEKISVIEDTLFETDLPVTLLPDTVEVKMYRFFYDDGLMACDYNTVNISFADILEDTKKNIYYGIQLKNLFYEGARLIVDLDKSMEEVMDWGSSGSLAYFNAILYTFASYPGVAEIKVLIDGVEDVEGSHFSFRGIFAAEAYKHDSLENE